MVALVLLLAFSSSHALSKSNVGAERRKLEAQFGARPADPEKTMAFLRARNLIGRDAAAASTGVDESGTVADVVARGALEQRRASLEAAADGAAGGIIDDMRRPFPSSTSGREWTTASDRVMGGLSTVESFGRETVAGRPANALRGRVTTANNGGFVSCGLDLGGLDASGYDGVRLDVYSPAAGGAYGLHLRTPDCARVFSSYRATLEAGPRWAAVDLPWAAFAGFGPGTDAPLDASSLARVSILGIGRDFDADFAFANLRLFRAEPDAPS